MEDLIPSYFEVTERELFSLCGLTFSEKTILVHLLRNRGATAGSISRKTGIKRPTVYSALSNLEQLGLVSKMRLDGKARYTSIGLKAIPSLLRERAKEQLDKTERAVTLLEQQLDGLKEDIERIVPEIDLTFDDTTVLIYELSELDLLEFLEKESIAQKTPTILLSEELLERLSLREILDSTPLIEIIVKNRETDDREFLLFLSEGTSVIGTAEGNTYKIVKIEDRKLSELLNLFVRKRL